MSTDKTDDAKAKAHADIQAMFTYVPPTGTTKPMYAEMDACERRIQTILWAIAWGPTAKHPASREELAQVTAEYEQYAHAMVEMCPASADLTAAIRCLRISRNAALEYMTAAHGDGMVQTIALSELRKARYQAKAAIALGVK